MSIQLQQQAMDVSLGKEMRFFSTIGTMGKDRKIINIPKKFHKEMEQLEGKEVVVTIRELIIKEKV